MRKPLTHSISAPACWRARHSPRTWSRGEVKYDVHVPSKWNTVTWGIYSAEYAPVARVKSGAVVKIDIANPSGSNRANPEKFFIDNKISMDIPVVQEIIEIQKKTPHAPFRTARRAAHGPDVHRRR